MQLMDGQPGNWYAARLRWERPTRSSRSPTPESPMRFTKSLRHPAWRGVWLGLVSALVVWLVTVRSGMLRGLEDWMLDGAFFYRGSRPTTANIVIVGIDEPS